MTKTPCDKRELHGPAEEAGTTMERRTGGHELGRTRRKLSQS